MRLRNDPHAKEILNNNKNWYISEPHLNNIKTWFNNINPIYVEIGSGKGDFIIKNALLNPNINYVAIERNVVVCSKIIKKIVNSKEVLPNLKVLNIDANQLLDIFKNNTMIEKIFLNFSDPWPKKRHIKNRLTNPKFLNLYQQILIPHGWVEMKTDNDGLFEYTMQILEQNESLYEVIYKTRDLYSDLKNRYNIDNIPTEYEKKFHNIGKKINKVIFKFKNIDNI